MLMKIPLLNDLLVRLHVVASLEVGPALETQTALGVLAHFGDVFFDVAERC
jgi:hypothetical protein